MIYFVQYGCTECLENLIVESDDISNVEDYARQAALDCYYSYDRDFLTEEEAMNYGEEEICEMEWEAAEMDIFWSVDLFDDKDEEHLDYLRTQEGRPFIV